jgi:hypothetical protein
MKQFRFRSSLKKRPVKQQLLGESEREESLRQWWQVQQKEEGRLG